MHEHATDTKSWEGTLDKQFEAFRLNASEVKMNTEYTLFQLDENNNVVPKTATDVFIKGIDYDQNTVTFTVSGSVHVTTFAQLGLEPGNGKCLMACDTAQTVITAIGRDDIAESLMQMQFAPSYGNRGFIADRNRMVFVHDEIPMREHLVA